MAASVITPQWVVNDIAREFRNKVILAGLADRSYDSQFQVKGANVGATIQARLPQRPRAASGAALNKQPLIDQTFEVKITDQTNIGIELSSYTLSLEKSEIRRVLIQPAANALVQDMEAKGFQRMYKKVPNSIGTIGVSPTAGITYSQGVAKLKDMAGNVDDLFAILSHDQSAVIADAQKSYFLPGNAITSSFRNGQFGGSAYGVNEWLASPNVAQHTTGTFTASTPLVNVAGGVAEGATSMATDGWASGASSLKEGDVFTIEGVYEINSANFSSTGRLRQFTVTVDASDTTGAMTINFFPAVYASAGPRQNVNALPADNAGIRVWGSALSNGTLSTTTSRQGLIAAPGTFILAMADAADVDAPVCVFARDEEAGISMRLTKSYDIDTDNNLARLDMFWGFSAARPEWTALRVQGA